MTCEESLVAMMGRRGFLQWTGRTALAAGIGAAIAGAGACGGSAATDAAESQPVPAENRPTCLIGYTEYRANLPGGMHPYMTSQRACVVRADGGGRRVPATELTREPNTWTSFAGWSPDGRAAVLSSGWESPENAAWEEEHQTFRMTQGWRHDQCLVELSSGRVTNVTAVERVSDYNAGLFFWPKDPTRLGFEAMIDGMMTPFSMALDGTQKKDLSFGKREFTYGLNASPDGARIAYHKSYQVYVADADGRHAVHVDTGQPFNFCPRWSPDGQWLLFLSGEHYSCHPHLVRRDGSGLRKLADRQGYRGVVELLDTAAFHSASSDVPVWASDGRWVYYTAKWGESIELMRVSLEGRVERLTRSAPGVLHYHPTPSPDGGWVLFGTKRGGSRQLCVARADGSGAYAVTRVPEGWGAAHGHWQPQSTPGASGTPTPGP